MSNKGCIPVKAADFAKIVRDSLNIRWYVYRVYDSWEVFQSSEQRYLGAIAEIEWDGNNTYKVIPLNGVSSVYYPEDWNDMEKYLEEVERVNKEL